MTTVPPRGLELKLAVTLLMLTCNFLALPSSTRSATREGSSHGYIILRDSAGKIIASGEDIQTTRGNRLSSRLIFHFKDGSLDDDTTVAEQGETVRLISDHHVQRGPSFPAALDVSIDMAAQRVRFVQDGSKETKSIHMDLPPDLSNGIFFTLMRNIKISNDVAELPYLTVSSSPRLVKLAISRDGTDKYSVGGTTYTADRYLVKIHIGGVSGVIAPVIGKAPGNFHVWISSGTAPAILRADGPLFDGGPVWSLQQASPTW